MGNERILVIEPDNGLRAAITGTLGGKGYQVASAPDENEGFVQAIRILPDVIVLEAEALDMPKLVRTLRARPQAALIPILFLGPRDAVEEKVHGFRLASDDCLSKPVDPQELELRVALALKVRRKTEEQVAAMRPPERSGEDFTIPGGLMTFRGTLDQIALSTLLTLFEMEQKSGMVVLITEPEKEKSRLYMRQGRLVRAEMDGKPQPRNSALVYYLLGKTQGRFDFRPLAVTHKDEVNTPTTMLLLEGARLLDEARRKT